jgi:ElaB/YqjD/DUF883 family membrane-anchored ribosome-binding protein
MRQSDVRKQFKAAIRNAESALQDLSDRFDDLPGARSRIRRAGRSLRRTAGSVAEHVPFERASAIAADTGRTVRAHPVTTLMTAAIAGYCIWSLVRYATERTAPGEMTGRTAGEDDLDDLQPGVEAPGETASYPRH